MTDAPAYLRLDRVVKSYDGRINAVDDVSLSIAKGEFITLLGPSGSGKTTTLMMVAGFERPNSGTITIAGRDLTNTSPWQRNMGVVFQNYALFPHMTVERNVAFPLRMRHQARPEIERRVRQVLALVGLEAFAARYPRELSGGQQQRVALARGLVFNPDVLLLDEPLGALDKNLREQMQVEIKRIHREVGITMIYVTHDQTEAMTMSDRIAVFSEGRIEQVADPLTVYHRPATRFVGQFVGDSNFFAGRALAGGEIEIEGIGRLPLARDHAAAVSPASPLHIMVRPERIKVLAPGSSTPDCTCSMQVSAVINYGESVLVLGNSAGNDLRMRLSGASSADFAEGAVIPVGWNRNDVHIIAG